MIKIDFSEPKKLYKRKLEWVSAPDNERHMTKFGPLYYVYTSSTNYLQVFSEWLEPIHMSIPKCLEGYKGKLDLELKLDLIDDFVCKLSMAMSKLDEKHD